MSPSILMSLFQTVVHGQDQVLCHCKSRVAGNAQPLMVAKGKKRRLGV